MEVVIKDEMKVKKKGTELVSFTEEYDGIYYSQYARIFNQESLYWDSISESADRVMLFLKNQQTYINDVLKLEKRVYLNDVYELLGLSKTEIGGRVGWRYLEENLVGDNFIDFGIYREENRAFITGDISEPLILDFNVDGLV